MVEGHGTCRALALLQAWHETVAVENGFCCEKDFRSHGRCRALALRHALHETVAVENGLKMAVASLMSRLGKLNLTEASHSEFLQQQKCETVAFQF